VLTGQKVWTSFAHYANWCTVLARTDFGRASAPGTDLLSGRHGEPRLHGAPAAPDEWRQRVQRDLPGRRGGAEGNVLGREHGGWEVAITTLMFERGPRTLTRQLILRQGLAELLELARPPTRAGPPAARDPLVRQRLAQWQYRAPSAPAGTRSRVGPRRSCAISSPSASSGCRRTRSRMYAGRHARERAGHAAFIMAGSGEAVTYTSGPAPSRGRGTGNRSAIWDGRTSRATST